MPEDMTGASAVSPQPDEKTAPSAEATQRSEQVPETGTPSSTTPAQPAEHDVPFHQHPRWIERQQELEALRQQNQALTQTVQRMAQLPQPTQASQPAADPWDGYVNHVDPVQAQFWTQMRALVQHERQLAKHEAIRELQPVIQAGMQELVQLNLREFRKENPEVTPGSKEEANMIAYMDGRIDGVRHSLESAKRNALYDRIALENQALKGSQQSARTKLAANTSEASPGIPSTATLPAKAGNWRDRVRASYRKGGSLTEIANAAGMTSE